MHRRPISVSLLTGICEPKELVVVGDSIWIVEQPQSGFAQPISKLEVFIGRLLEIFIELSTAPQELFLEAQIAGVKVVVTELTLAAKLMVSE